MSDAFRRGIDKGTVPGVTMMVVRRSQIGWLDALGRQNPASLASTAHNILFRIIAMTKRSSPSASGRSFIRGEGDGATPFPYCHL